MEFAKPELLSLFYLIPVLIIVFYIYYLWEYKTIKQWFHQKTFLQINPLYSFSSKLVHFFLRIVAVCFLILTLSGPRVGTKLKVVNREGVDIVFALDVSKSMLVQDIAPDRLSKSIQILSKTIDKLVADRVGIIVYAGDAYPLMPLSFDYSMAKLLIKNIDTDIVPSQGTDVSSALLLSDKYFDQKERSKIIFILSDGEDHVDNYTQEINSLSNNNTIVCAINIGTDSGGPIPIKNGGALNYKKDKNGEIVISKSNYLALKNIASSSNGSFIKTKNTDDALQFVFDNIKNLDKQSEEEEMYSDFEHQFQWFLALALFFILLDLILVQKRVNFMRKIIDKK